MKEKEQFMSEIIASHFRYPEFGRVNSLTSVFDFVKNFFLFCFVFKNSDVPPSTVLIGFVISEFIKNVLFIGIAESGRVEPSTGISAV